MNHRSIFKSLSSRLAKLESSLEHLDRSGLIDGILRRHEDPEFYRDHEKLFNAFYREVDKHGLYEDDVRKALRALTDSQIKKWYNKFMSADSDVKLAAARPAPPRKMGQFRKNVSTGSKRLFSLGDEVLIRAWYSGRDANESGEIIKHVPKGQLGNIFGYIVQVTDSGRQLVVPEDAIELASAISASELASSSYPLDNIEVFDNEGETWDQYTVVWPDGSALGLSSDPANPQGFSQWTEADPGPHLGKRITFDQLPSEVREHVLGRVGSVEDEDETMSSSADLEELIEDGDEEAITNHFKKNLDPEEATMYSALPATLAVYEVATHGEITAQSDIQDSKVSDALDGKLNLVQEAIDADWVDLLQYMDDPALKDKIVSIQKPTVKEIRAGNILVIWPIQTNEVLSDEDKESLADYINGQAADGWGEGFEQKPIHEEMVQEYYEDEMVPISVTYSASVWSADGPETSIRHTQ